MHTSKIITNKSKKLALKSILAIAGVAGFNNLHAINGVFDYGYGQINRGMGGAGVAMPQDAFATFINPAGLGEISHNFDAGVAVYFPNMYSDFGPGSAGFIAAAPGKHDSKTKVFFMPDFSYVYHMDKQNHFALSLTSIGGYGSKYETKKAASSFVAPPIGPAVTPKGGLLGDGTVKSSLKIGSINATYNYVVDQFFSWGITFSHYVQAFESRGSQGLAAFTTQFLNSGGTATITKMSNNGTDYNNGFGVTVGALVKPHPMVALGFSGTPKVRMSKLTKYRNLMAENGRLDIPGRFVAGVRVIPNQDLNIVADVVRILNRDVKTYGNNSRALVDGRCTLGNANFSPEDCMGGLNGAGFGWSNQTLVKVGGEYKLTNRDIVRLGVSYGNKIGHTKDIVVNTLAPGAAAKWITSAGYSRRMPSYKINSFLTFIPSQKMDGVNELSVGDQQTVEIKVGGFGLGLGISA